jgi:hypothetical protein
LWGVLPYAPNIKKQINIIAGDVQLQLSEQPMLTRLKQQVIPAQAGIHLPDPHTFASPAAGAHPFAVG